MVKLLLINESFTNPIFYRRWELLAEQHKDWDITLLAPKKEDIKALKNSFGHNVTIRGNEIDYDNFHIELFTKKDFPFLGWYSPDFKKYFEKLKPDVIYNIGGHHQLSVIQLIILRNKYLPTSKMLSFSMRGPQYNLSFYKKRITPFSQYLRRRLYYVYAKTALSIYNKNIDAVFCHYPKAVKCFRDEGFNGPIYMQTQVGVNPELFHEDMQWREEIRSKYNIGDSTYVFGSATRFTPDKGLYEIIDALPQEGDWAYLMMGSGMEDEERSLREIIKQRGLEQRIIQTGFINLKEMPKYWNAIDCMLHVPKETLRWEETFSIALVQGMITGKPVIGSDSGSVPYQIGPDGIIVPEGDVRALHEKLVWVLSHKEEAKAIGRKLQERTYNSFSIMHLNEMFYDTVMEDVLNNRYDEEKMDMANYKTQQERKHEEQKNQ